jgi:CubicO group peptidase (beta-lactamase class C family)
VTPYIRIVLSLDPLNGVANMINLRHNVRWPTWGAVRGQPRRMIGMSAILLSTALALSTLGSWSSHATRASGQSVSAGLNAYLTGLTTQGQFSGTVLVAQHGAILLSKGYGPADRAKKIPNTPNTKYPVGGVNANISILGILRLEEQGKLSDQAPICTYITKCPAAWAPITVHMVLDGTSHLPNYDWGKPGHTTAQSIHALQIEPLSGKPGAGIDYENGDTLVLGAIIEKVSGLPWATFIQEAILGPAGMTHSGRVTDVLIPPARAQDYSGQTANPSIAYNDFFETYATVPDVYAFDEALFGGKLISKHDLATLLIGRAPIVSTPPGITEARYGYNWAIGRLFQHRVIYTEGRTNSFQTANLRFPQDGVTIVVISNDEQNDAPHITQHVAAIVFGQSLVAPAPVPAGPAPLLGRYRRTFQDADRVAAHDPGLQDWVGGTITITVSKDSIHFAIMDNKPEDSVDEFYTATPDGSLTLGGYLPTNHNSFCATDPHLDPPTATFHWTHKGNHLIITRIAFDPCLDRGATVPGTWTKLG